MLSCDYMGKWCPAVGIVLLTGGMLHRYGYAVLLAVT